MKIYIIRHGETVANEQSRLQGCSNWPLNRLGIELAEETGRGLQGVKFDAAFSSPLVRAYDTAKMILKENGNFSLPIAIDDRIKEINMGTWENKTLQEVKERFTEEKANLFFHDPFAFGKFPEGESAYDVCKRTQEFIHELAKKQEYANVLVTSHGFAIRGMLNFMYEDRSSFWQERVPYNCACNIIETDGETFSFVAKDKLYYDPKKCVDRYALK